MIDTSERLFLDGERAKKYTPYHETSGDWAAVTTPLEITPGVGRVDVITRLGFTIYNPTTATGPPMKMEFFDGSDWIELQKAVCFGCLLCVASRVDYGTIPGANIYNIAWHYKNAIRLVGTNEEKLRIVPTGLVNWCSGIFCGMRYLEYGGNF